MDNQLVFLGNKIRSLREEYNLTQKELSSKIGLTPKMISFYENNQRIPPLDILIKLSKLFNITIDQLVGNSITKESTNTYNYTITWDRVCANYPNAILVDPETKDLITYYNELGIKDKRWIMGQIIDLNRKKEDTSQNRAVGK